MLHLHMPGEGAVCGEAGATDGALEFLESLMCPQMLLEHASSHKVLVTEAAKIRLLSWKNHRT